MCVNLTFSGAWDDIPHSAFPIKKATPGSLGVALKDGRRIGSRRYFVLYFFVACFEDSQNSFRHPSEAWDLNPNRLLENHFAFNHHLADVDEGITHTAECRIDAHTGERGDFLKTHVGVMAQNDHFTLFGWK